MLHTIGAAAPELEVDGEPPLHPLLTSVGLHRLRLEHPCAMAAALAPDENPL